MIASSPALAEDLETDFVTTDRQLLRAFPDLAVTPAHVLARD